MNLISIQSHVAYGHVGNSATVFPLQRLGIDVWPIHTVQFANHAGYGPPRGAVFDGAMIRDMMQGIEERGVLGACDGVISGYMRSAKRSWTRSRGRSGPIRRRVMAAIR